MPAPLLELDAVTRIYGGAAGLFRRGAAVKAVSGLSLAVARRKTLGLVGESGSGKSTTGRLALGLETPGSGQVRFAGRVMPAYGTVEWRALRRSMQMIYQDPLAALDRRLPIVEQVREPLDIHAIGTASERTDRAVAMLEAVGLGSGTAKRYPHEISGGQRQRVVLARALITEPELLVCDEPVSALDVSVQAQVVNLLEELQRRLGLAMLFISHDLRVVRQVSDRIAVMYLGQIVEEGPAETLFADPLHPYTQALVSASPEPGRKRSARIVLKGEPPNPAARPSGCAFHPRCPVAGPICRVEEPRLEHRVGVRQIRCHYHSAGGGGRVQPPIAP